MSDVGGGFEVSPEMAAAREAMKQQRKALKEGRPISWDNFSEPAPVKTPPPLPPRPEPVTVPIVEEPIYMPPKKKAVPEALTASIPLRLTPSMKQRVDNLCIAIESGQNEFCRAAVEKELRRLEKKHCGGNPFPKKGKLSVGRRTVSS